MKKQILKKLILDFCTKTVFSFNSQLFQQVDAVSMGCSPGPVLANITLIEFEKHVISNLIHSGIIKFYTCMSTIHPYLIKPCDIPTVLAKFNSFDKNLQFTIDSFSNNLIHFMDIRMCIVKILTLLNIHISLAWSRFHAKWFGLNLFSTEHLWFVATRHFFDTQINQLINLLCPRMALQIPSKSHWLKG